MIVTCVKQLAVDWESRNYTVEVACSMVSAWKVSTCVLDIYQHSSLSSHPSFVDFHQ